ncbi:glycosyltransferase family 2 protein [Sphingomonas sp. ID1715]|uniref:glycosyltransferase family 2 protein n=1 Tax=Sphingomonas sp. ID1715 TaxID=1656898 RepID=UPI001488C775|nr:glycosyltransferase family 2 protein [Sphingomonas sp. ID1715]NNM78598.1 glycosyltransferase family 2 protein [Sphingomonas sp. ID1715]
MAVYNEEGFIQDAMDSILGQTGPEIELVVVDDLSTDGTVRIVEERAARDPRVRFFRVPEKGKVRAFNLGISQARGEWVCLFAGDDLMPPGSLNERYESVKDQPLDVPVIGTCRLITMSENRKLDGQIVPRNPNKQTYSGVCFLMNRQAVARMWPVPEVLPNEDTWMELAARYLGMRSIVSSTIGAKWRIHSGNSINMLVPYEEFNRKLSARMIAPEVFLAQHRDELTSGAVRALRAHARCEQARKQGNILGILRSGVSLVDALRAIALSGPKLYAFRRRAYKLFSGW